MSLPNYRTWQQRRLWLALVLAMSVVTVCGRLPSRNQLRRLSSTRPSFCCSITAICAATRPTCRI